MPTSPNRIICAPRERALRGAAGACPGSIAVVPSRAAARLISCCVLMTAVLAVAGATAARSADSKTVVIGISGPTSGAGAIYAAMPNGTKHYLEYMNDRGGVNGYKFDVTLLDNQATASGGATTVQRLLTQKPFALVVNGSAAYAAAANLIKAQAPTTTTFVTASAAVIAAQGYKHAYGFNPNYTRECYFHVKYAKDVLKVKKIAIVWQDDAVGQDAGKKCPNFATRSGIAGVTSLPLPNTTTDFGPFAAKIKESGAKAVVVISFSGLLAGLQKSAVAIGYKGKWMTFSTNDIAYAKLAGSVAEGTYIDQFLEQPGAKTASMRLMTREMTKRFGADGVNSSGSTGWTIGAIIAHAVKTATANGKALTNESFEAALNSIKDMRLGVVANVTYKGKDHTTIVRKLSMFQVRDGRLVQIVPPSAVPTGSSG